MGSGTSSLTIEQKAHISKLMKEKYEILNNSNNNNNNNIENEKEIQKEMEKYYNELILSLKPPVSLDSLRKEQAKKKQPTRRRSYGDDKLKGKRDLPPRPQGKVNQTNNSNNNNHSSNNNNTSSTSSSTTTNTNTTESGDNQNHQHSSGHGESSEAHDENVDSWESVRAQPSCLLCKMVFSTESKYETHIKYSEVHAKNLARQNNKDNGESSSLPSSTTAEKLVVAQPTSLPPGPRCREIYTGSKFFWRYKQTVEVNIYLHLTSTPRCVEICCYNNNHSYEYPRIYLDEQKIYQYVGDKYIKDRVEEMKDNIPAQEPLPADEILEDEVKRVIISSHIMNKLQLLKDDQINSISTESQSTSTSTATIKEQEKMFYVFTASLIIPTAETPLLSSSTLPENLIPVMITRRRLSTSKEIESAFENFNNLGAQLLHSTEKAEQIINKITEENTNLFKQSHEMMVRANSRDGPRSARSQVGE